MDNQDQKLIVQEEGSQKKANPQVPNTNQSRIVLSMILVVILLIVNLLGLGLASWYFNDKTRDFENESRGKYDQLNSTLSKIDNANPEINQKINQLQDAIEKQQKLINVKLEKNQTEQQKWMKDVEDQIFGIQKTNKDPKAALQQELVNTEVDFLIRTAQQKLSLTGDSKMVIQLLDAADDRLKKSKNIRAIKVREAIAVDKTQLKLLEANDPVSSFLTIESLSKYLKEMPLISLDDQGEIVGEKNDKSHLSLSITSVLDKWFKVTDITDKPIQLLSTKDRVVIRENVEFMLHEIQYAIMTNNVKFKDSALSKLNTYLKEYYILNNSQNEFIVSEIKKLEGANTLQINSIILSAIDVLQEFDVKQKDVVQGVE